MCSDTAAVRQYVQHLELYQILPKKNEKHNTIRKYYKLANYRLIFSLAMLNKIIISLVEAHSVVKQLLVLLMCVKFKSRRGANASQRRHWMAVVHLCWQLHVCASL